MSVTREEEQTQISAGPCVLADPLKGTMFGRRYALIAAITDYQSVSPFHNELPPNLVQGAERLGQALVHNCKVDKDNVSYLSNQLSYNAFYRHLDETLKDLTAADLMIVYFAGHGKRVGNSVALVFSDSDLNSNREVLYPYGLTKLLAASPAMKLIFLDCCYSQSIFEDTDFKELIASGGPLTVACCCGKNAVSQSRGRLGTPFNTELISVLEETREKPQADGSLLLREVLDRVVERVKLSSEDRQIPFYQSGNDQLLNLPFAWPVSDHEKHEKLIRLNQMELTDRLIPSQRKLLEWALKRQHRHAPPFSWEKPWRQQANLLSNPSAQDENRLLSDFHHWVNRLLLRFVSLLVIVISGLMVTVTILGWKTIAQPVYAPLLSAAVFPDVPRYYPAYNAISQLSSVHILQGLSRKGDTALKFYPEEPITRIDAATALARADSNGRASYSTIAGQDLPAINVIKDLDANDYSDYIFPLGARGILTTMDFQDSPIMPPGSTRSPLSKRADGYFNPSGSLRQIDFIRWLYYFTFPESNHHETQSQMRTRLVDDGVLPSTQPQQNTCSRADFAAALYKAIKVWH